MKKFIAAVGIALALAGCTRIESGTVGVRIDASKQVENQELMPGSFNQTIWGDVLIFPVRDILVKIDDLAPLTSDNSALSDFDLTVVYSINPSEVTEIYTRKSRSFHFVDAQTGDIYLMYNYIYPLVNNAVNRAVRKYESLKVADNRENIERDIREFIYDQLKKEGIAESITLTAVQIRNIVPNSEILEAANNYVRANNELRVKTTEVEIARKEAERLSILASTAKQSIEFMNAESKKLIAQAIFEGKVNTIVVPSDFEGIIDTRR